MSGKLIEIASYPKCGNTWLRHIFGKLLEVDPSVDIPDIHQRKKEIHNYLRWFDISNSRSKPFSMYKSHVLDNPDLTPDMIVLIYRHPLDVFLSSLNYSYIRKRREIFINEIPKSVEDICNDNEMDFYFSRFLEDGGKHFYSGMLGDMSDYTLYLKTALRNKKVISVRYEDLLENPCDETIRILRGLDIGGEGRVSQPLFERVNKVTKNSNKPFYWKSRKKNYVFYLTREQISQYQSSNSEFLREVGYWQHF